MPFDPFESSSDSLISPAKTAFSIMPDDALDLPGATKAIFVGTGGDVNLRAVGSEADVVFRNVSSGSVLPIRVQAIRAAGTSASDIVGLS